MKQKPEIITVDGKIVGATCDMEDLKEMLEMLAGKKLK